MKNAKKCPKCQSTDILRIPNVLPRYQGNTIPLGSGGIKLVELTKYLCGSCGFVETWIDEAGVAKLKAKFGRSAPG